MEIFIDFALVVMAISLAIFVIIVLQYRSGMRYDAAQKIITARNTWKK